MRDKSKGLTMLFALMPGAGHLYLGYMQKGIILMGAFFLSTFLIDFMRLSLFFFLLPVIWCYSFFDALHLRNSEEIKEELKGDNLLELEIFSFLKKPKIVGYLLLGFGVVMIFERIVKDFIDYRLVNYIQTGLIAALLILGGIKLITSPIVKVKGEEKECENGE